MGEPQPVAIWRARLPREAIAFGAVGIGATLTHFLTASVAVFAGAGLSGANVIGFAVAFLVSYLGHYYLSFRSTKAHRAAFWRFALVALIGFGVNNAVLQLIRLATGLYDMRSLGVALVTAAGAVFLLSKFWAFASGRPKI